MEDVRLPLTVVEQTIVTRMKTPGYRKTGAHLDCNPMPEIETPFLQKRAEKNVPFWKIVEEQGTTWFQYSNTFRQPLFAPFNVMALWQGVISALAVLFANVERWVCKYGVDNATPNHRQQLHTVGIVEGSQIRRKERRDSPTLIRQKWRWVELLFRPFKLSLCHTVLIVIVSQAIPSVNQQSSGL